MDVNTGKTVAFDAFDDNRNDSEMRNRSWRLPVIFAGESKRRKHPFAFREKEVPLCRQ